MVAVAMDPEWFKKDGEDDAPQDGGMLRIEQEVRDSMMTPQERARLQDEERAQQMRNVVAWWLDVSREDAEHTIPKAMEYGAADLNIMGSALVAGSGDLWGGVDADERESAGVQMAILFYLHGKVARALSAMQSGRFASADTLHDITVYSMMLRRVKETGTWV